MTRKEKFEAAWKKYEAEAEEAREHAINRLTQRDEYGNADIIALSDVMPEVYAGLSFSETNAITYEVIGNRFDNPELLKGK